MKNHYTDKIQIDSEFGRVSFALKRMFLNANGDLHDDGVLILKYLRKFCKDKNVLMVSSHTGMVDVNATFVALGRREIYDRICQLLYLSDRKITEVQQAVTD